MYAIVNEDPDFLKLLIEHGPRVMTLKLDPRFPSYAAVPGQITHLQIAPVCGTSDVALVLLSTQALKAIENEVRKQPQS